MVTEIAASPADIVQRARLYAELSQTQLAERIGTTQSAVSRWERGHDEPRLSTLAQICRACGLQLGLVTEPDDVDRAQIRQHLAMTPADRLAAVVNVTGVLAAAQSVD